MPDIQNLITENLDIWTGAIKKKSATGRGSNSKVELTGIKKLRELILELAVRGRLVPQDTNDEPASALLKKIAEKKAQLVSDKKIKKTKALPVITDDEKSFELPVNWEWTRWDNIAIKIGDIDHKMPTEQPNGVPYVSPRDFFPNNVINFDNAKKISRIDFERLAAKIQPQKGDIIFPRYGTIGANMLVETDIDFLASYSCCLIKTMHEFISAKYQFVFSLSLFVKEQCKKTVKKTTQPNVGIKSIQEFVVPLPPLPEQNRIVAKVDELMALCDKLEQQTVDSIQAHQTLVEVLLNTLTNSENAEDFQHNWQLIAEHFDTLFTTEHSVDQLKQTILQLAVMGKLVPQNTDDEPASVLLKKIAAEKAQLIADKKIKKQKPLPEITEEEKPCILPSGWAFERIGTLGIVGTGATPSRANFDYWNPAEFNWVSSGETSNLFVSETKEKISALAIQETNVSLYPAGTLIVAMYGQGKTRGQITELLCEAGTNQACAAIRLIEESESHKAYVKLYFRKAYSELRSQAAGGAQPNLNVAKISNTVLAIPPINEQLRIVHKVDELMTLCEKLKTNMQQNQITKVNLAETLVKQGLS